MQPQWITVWRFLEKLGIKLPDDPTIPLLNIYPKEIIIARVKCTQKFLAALFTKVTTWKPPKCPLTD